MDKIYAIGTSTGPLHYFKVFTDAIAYWNYLEFGDGVNPPPCNLFGIHKGEITLTEIKLLDMDEEFMEMVHAANARRKSIEQSRRISELRQTSDAVSIWTGQTSWS